MVFFNGLDSVKEMIVLVMRRELAKRGMLVTLAGHLQNMTVPFLITHGANDRQIPIEYAYQSRAEAVNSPKVELKVFTDREGGVEHVSGDNMEPVRSYIADWLVENL
jgi:alpha-beta hydrolase superfamily lysophospholipase